MSDTLIPIFEDAIAKHIFPGAVVWLEHDKKVLAHRAYGSTAYNAAYSQPVTTDTLYDVASLTKLFTTTALLLAVRPTQTSIDTPLAEFLPEFAVVDKRSITLRDLLQHNSGIDLAIQALIAISPDEWISHIAQAPLHSEPKTKVLYSCTNFFLLARVVEMLSNQPLDDYITTQILQPLQMLRTTWLPLNDFAVEEIAPTEQGQEQLWHGIVHDEAARTWQQYTGHVSSGNSGLFSTAHDLAKFAAMWCQNGTYQGTQILTREEVDSIFPNPAHELNPIARRGLGWQLNATFFMSEKAPADAAGHTGFTGPTLWLSRSTGHICIILNNRVYPTRDTSSRFPYHRRIARWLLNQVI
jgi:CubicO group peptidase (beta-lactamase class C family)